MKTAVDWLVEQYEQEFNTTMSIIMEKQIHQAKEMEKQQIIESYYAGTAQFDNSAPIVNPKTPEQYYNETYEK